MIGWNYKKLQTRGSLQMTFEDRIELTNCKMVIKKLVNYSLSILLIHNLLFA